MNFCHFLAQLLQILHLVSGEKYKEILNFRNVVSGDYCSQSNETLKFVSVVFRHGDRTPIYPEESYPNDPNKNFLSQFDAPSVLTESGEFRAFELGKFLRNKYDTFLGNNYLNESVEARSTNAKRAKQTLNYVLKALYPDVKVPTTFTPLFEDQLLLPISCTRYILDSFKILKSPDLLDETKNLLPFMELLKNNSGKNIRGSVDMLLLYTTLETQKYMNLSLPKWTDDIFPKGSDFIKGVALQYKIFNYNENLKKQNGGMLIKKFIADMESVKNCSMNKNKKLMLYSGHDINIVAVLSALGIYDQNLPEIRFGEIPKFSSAVIVELHLIEKNYYVKVLYYQGIPAKSMELKIPGCDVLCPLNQFSDLMQNVTPNKVDFFCPPVDESQESEESLKFLKYVKNKIRTVFA